MQFVAHDRRVPFGLAFEPVNLAVQPVGSLVLKGAVIVGVQLKVE